MHLAGLQPTLLSFVVYFRRPKPCILLCTISYLPIDTFRVRGVAGGDRINYTGVVSSSTASLQLVKTLLHSVVSDNAECMTIDIDDFFLLSTPPRAEYIRIPVSILPDDIREEFKLDQYIYNGFVLFEVTKGMYGLP